MNSKERIEALLKGEKIDRIPAVPLIFNHGARIIGEPVSKFNSDVDTMVKGNIAAYRKYGSDLIIIFTTTATLAESMGTKLKFPYDDVPHVEVPIVQEEKNIDLIKIPDPYIDGRLPIYLEAAKRIKEEVGDEVNLSVAVAGPFTNAAHLRGTERFILDTYKNKKLVDNLLKQSIKAAKVFIDELAKLDAIPLIVEPVASTNLISPKQFKEFALPYLQEMVSYIHSKGLPSILHVCGKTPLIVDLMADTGTDIISIDTIDIAVAKEKVGDRVVILGNVDPAKTILKGKPEDVHRAVKDIIEKGRDSKKGIIVSSGCEVPINSPFENVAALVKATKELS